MMREARSPIPITHLLFDRIAATQQVGSKWTGRDSESAGCES
jgi:hypothetical protein